MILKKVIPVMIKEVCKLLWDCGNVLNLGEFVVICDT